MTWDCRQLKTLNKTGLNMAFQYDADGRRVKKTVNGTATTYWRDTDGKIMKMQKGNDILLFMYEGDGSLIGFTLNGTPYYYLYNGQGDVIGLMDSGANLVAEYVYDSWGRPVSVTGSLAATVGQLNPFRYRGYEYDAETGLYYLLSRYYDPMTMRFVNADSQVSTGSDLTGTNLFVYCANNPVNRCDPNGTAWVYNGVVYNYDGSIADFHRAEKGLSPLAYEAAKMSSKSVASGISPWGTPNTHVDDYTDGYHKERWYGENGRATKDRHHTDHRNPKQHPNPHDQEWDWSDPDHPKLGDPYPSPKEISINWEPVVGVGLICIAAVSTIWVIGNDITGIGAADNGAIIPIFSTFTKGLEMVMG